jgi:hypothetical protein
MQIKYTPEEWKKVLENYFKTNALCPLCGTPIYARIVSIERDEEGKVKAFFEQVCENHECTYNPIKSYEIQIEP